MHAVLAKDYPRDIRDAYVGAVRKSRPSERHQRLLRLGETGLAYLASLSIADYWSARRSDPDPAVENQIADVSRITAGEYLHIFHTAQRAVGRTEIFGIKRYEVNAKLSHAARLAAAVRAVDHAQRVGATNVKAAIEEGLKTPHKAVRWLRFWNDFVEYRNRVIHADDKGWPIDADGYFEAMTPLLEAAVVEALTTEYIAHVLLEYPVARLTQVARVESDWSLEFDGEYRGAPLLADIRRPEPPSAWESNVGRSYVLARQSSGEWDVYARFFDLKRGDAPSGDGAQAPPATSSQASASAPGDTLMDQTQQSHGPAAREGETASTPAAPLPGATGGQVRPEASVPRSFPGVGAAGADQWLGPGGTHPTTPRTGSQRGHSTPVAASPASDAPRETSQGETWFPSFSPWMLWGILSLGLLAGAGFLWVASRLRDRRLRNWGIAYCAVAACVLVIAGVVGDSDDYPVLDAIAASLLFGMWGVSTVHAFVVNPRIKRERRHQ